MTRKGCASYKNLTYQQRLALFDENEGLVYHIATRYKCHENLREDMIQEGKLGLWLAICDLDKYNPKKGALSRWLGWGITRRIGEFTWAAANNSGLSAGPRVVQTVMSRNSKEDGVISGRDEDARLLSKSFSLDSPLCDEGKKQVFFLDRFGAEDEQYDGMNDAVKRLLSKLGSEDSDLLVRRFGIGCEPQTFDEIGKAYGLTPQAIGLRLKKVLEKIREMSGTAMLAIYL